MQKFAGRALIALWCGSGMLLGTPSRALAAPEANEPQGVDVSFKTGMLTGKITVLDAKGAKSQIFSFAGLPLIVALNHDVSPKTTVAVFGEVVMDSANTQISRESFGGSLSYSLFGGAPSFPLVQQQGYAVHADGGHWAFAFITQGAVERYSIVSKKTATSGEGASTSFSGSAVEVQGGFEGLRHFGKSSSFGIELMVSIFSLPASSQQFGATTTEILFAWRTHL